MFQIPKATDSYQQLVEQGFPQLISFLSGVNGFNDELAALEVIRTKTKSIIEKLLQPIEPMGLITHTDFWCNNLLVKEHIQANNSDNMKNEDIDCIILDWQMITYSRLVITCDFKFSSSTDQSEFFVSFFISFFSIHRPTNDLALLILSSLPSNIRREHTNTLLALYHKQMKLNLEKLNIDIETTLNYTKDKLLDDYK